jgi:hypothetical protein
MRELHLNHTQIGLIGASFLPLFSLGAVMVGVRGQHGTSKWALAALALIWSLRQLPMMLYLGVASLVASRMTLGFADDPAYLVSRLITPETTPPSIPPTVRRHLREHLKSV